MNHGNGEPNRWAKSSYQWGIYTWVGNALGCAISLVPIALPVGVILTVVTLGTGFYSFGAGWYGLKQSNEGDREASRWHAWVGIGLSAAHLVIVLIVGLLVYVFSGGIPGIKF